MFIGLFVSDLSAFQIKLFLVWKSRLLFSKQRALKWVPGPTWPSWAIILVWNWWLVSSHVGGCQCPATTKTGFGVVLEGKRKLLSLDAGKRLWVGLRAQQFPNKGWGAREASGNVWELPSVGYIRSSTSFSYLGSSNAGSNFGVVLVLNISAFFTNFSKWDRG